MSGALVVVDVDGNDGNEGNGGNDDGNDGGLTGVLTGGLYTVFAATVLVNSTKRVN